MRKQTVDYWFRFIILSILFILCCAVLYNRYESLSNFEFKKDKLEEILIHEEEIIANQQKILENERRILELAEENGTERHR